MIAVTRLDGTSVVVNADQIAWIEGHPDTVISLMNGEKLIVIETPEALVDRVKAFRRDLAAAPRRAVLSALTVADPSDGEPW